MAKTQTSKYSKEINIKTLSQLCTNVINKVIHIDLSMSTGDENPELTKPNEAISFEELLLAKIKQHPQSKTATKLTRVASGAEVITRTYLEKKKETEQKLSLENAQSSSKTTDDVVYLTNITKNDCQLRPFTAKDVNDLPPCLQKQKPHSPKVKIISNIVLNTRIEPHKNAQPNHKVYDSTKIYKEAKPGPSGLCKARYRRRSSTTTSVSGSISSYSDSDVMDIESDNTTSVNSLQAKDFTPDADQFNEEFQAPTYYSGDDVLVRYHTRQKWTYYVGQIENV
ncbi:jg14193 [Pararge aegeria aegeria]|uniref:Jg14193 protein n=1 Tax=Pararge aegeria aegeria TaxID=348720 RepID=A0A8S4QZJ5_9NEOP|nr:jg14193 [Pararge aegeria aegeria]